VLRRAGDLQGWSDLLRAHRSTGRLRLRLMDRPAAAGVRFMPANSRVADPPGGMIAVWPGCVAQVEVERCLPAPPSDNRRAWLLAEYEDGNTFALDPMPDGAGAPRLTRVGGDPLRLPRGEPGYVWLPDTIAVGTRFEVIVPVFDLSGQHPDIRALFDGLEQRLLTDWLETSSPRRRAAVRLALDEAAGLWLSHDIPLSLHCQKCEVVSRSAIRT
jgi:hypothetical protein